MTLPLRYCVANNLMLGSYQLLVLVFSRPILFGGDCPTCQFYFVLRSEMTYIGHKASICRDLFGAGGHLFFGRDFDSSEPLSKSERDMYIPRTP